MPRERSSGLVADYEIGPFFDEMFAAAGQPREHDRALSERLGALTDDGLREQIHTANAFFLTPPSRGVYRGTAAETLEVAVTISEP